MDTLIKIIALAVAAYGLVKIMYWKRDMKRQSAGKAGESQVRSALRWRLPRFPKIHNVTLENGTSTTQIDHIVFGEHFVYLIETKNYAGTIIGDPQQAKWKQRKGLMKTRLFENPLFQHRSHITAVAKTLNLRKSQIIPLVIFTNLADLKIKPRHDRIGHTRQIIKTIRKTEKDAKKHRLGLLPDNPKALKSQLNHNRLPRNAITNYRHKKNVRERFG